MAAEAGIVAAARTVVTGILARLEQQLIAEGLEAVLGPLEDKVASAAKGLVIKAVRNVLA